MQTELDHDQPVLGLGRTRNSKNLENATKKQAIKPRGNTCVDDPLQIIPFFKGGPIRTARAVNKVWKSEDGMTTHPQADGSLVISPGCFVLIGVGAQVHSLSPGTDLGLPPIGPSALQDPLVSADACPVRPCSLGNTQKMASVMCLPMVMPF